MLGVVEGGTARWAFTDPGTAAGEESPVAAAVAATGPIPIATNDETESRATESRIEPLPLAQHNA
jgi:hypothetical protein